MENEFYTFLTSDDVKMNKTIMLNHVNASLFAHEDTRIRFRYGYIRVSGEFVITITSNVISRRSVNERYTDM